MSVRMAPRRLRVSDTPFASASHAAPFVERMPPSPAATAWRNACPSALKAASATWWSSTPLASTCTVQACLHREPLERVREQRQSQAPDPVACERERDLRVRPSDEVDRGERTGLVHRHDGRPVPCDALA